MGAQAKASRTIAELYALAQGREMRERLQIGLARQ